MPGKSNNSSSNLTTSKYKGLISTIETLLLDAKSKVVKTVNQTMVFTYWQIGKYIVEYEQKGKERADYGTELLKRLSEDLTKFFGRGYSYRNMKLIRKFYLTFSKGQSLSAQSELAKWQSVISKLSWSHFVRLLSKDKPGVKKLAKKGQIIEHIDDVLKEPYILEFLGLEESNRYSENDFESAIIDNLGKFLLELGKGFSFVARQKRFSDGSDHYFIDLVFYNRLLKCFVLFDLKIGKITHKDIGQMQMYVNYYDREIKTSEENPTAGIILCKEKSDFVIKYTLPENNNQIFAKEYQLYLPQKEELKKLLSKFL